MLYLFTRLVFAVEDFPTACLTMMIVIAMGVGVGAAFVSLAMSWAH